MINVRGDHARRNVHHARDGCQRSLFGMLAKHCENAIATTVKVAMQVQRIRCMRLRQNAVWMNRVGLREYPVVAGAGVAVNEQGIT